MNKIVSLLVFALLVQIITLRGGEGAAAVPISIDFDQINNSLECALASIRLTNESAIPLSIRYSGDSAVNNNLLGKGWELPLFDSSLVEINESSFIWNSPIGGRSICTKVSPNVSIDGDYATITAGSWQYTYRKGIITEFRSSDKTKFSVTRNHDTTTLRRGNEEIVRMQKSNQKVSLTCSQYNFVFDLSKVPAVVGSNGLFVTLPQDGVKSITGGLNTVTFDWSINALKDSCFCLVSDSMGIKEARKYEPFAAVLTAADAALSNKPGIDKCDLGDGTFVEYYYVGGDSLATGKVRKIIYSKVDGSKIVRTFFYDKQGNLLRADNR